jgi:hypothetical protein
MKIKESKSMRSSQSLNLIRLRKELKSHRTKKRRLRKRRLKNRPEDQPEILERKPITILMSCLMQLMNKLQMEVKQVVALVLCWPKPTLPNFLKTPLAGLCLKSWMV